MDTSAQWPQQDMSKPMEEMTTIPSSVLLDQRNNNKAAALTRAPHKDRGGFSCPRCNSSNTKFCYYNNYSLSQPRFFCKTCRRYWTQGGSLRNIPVGGASRKNNNKALNINMITRTSASSSSSSAPPPTPPPNHNTDPAQQQNPSRKDEVLDLGFKSFADMIQLPTTFHQMPNYNNYAIMPVYGSLLPEAMINNKSSSSSLNFSLDYGSDYYNHSNSDDHNNNNNNNNNKSLFPFEDLKQQQDRDNDIHQTGDGFWNGVNLGSGGSW